MVFHLSDLVQLTALDHRTVEHVEHRLTQRLGPVDPDEHRASDVQAPLPQAHQQVGDQGGVLRRALHQRQRVLVALDVNAQRDDTAGFGEVRAVTGTRRPPRVTDPHSRPRRTAVCVMLCLPFGPASVITSASINACITCRPAPTANASRPSCMFSAMSVIATPTRSGNAVAPTDWIWLPFFMAVPLLLVCLGGRRTPTTRQVSSGDRRLNFYETRDNLGRVPGTDLVCCTSWPRQPVRPRPRRLSPPAGDHHDSGR
jgi:hypothetical protein